MKGKSLSIKEQIYRAAQNMDLWGYGIGGLPHIELEGDRHLLIEKHSGILEYNENEIRIAAKDMTISITGMDIQLLSMDKHNMTIGGIIASVDIIR